MSNNSEEFPTQQVEVTENMKKRNKALGLALVGLVFLITVVTIYRLDQVTP
ncbi:hypothetical protein QGN29_00855 [Temperatibacter marinus]|uniref:Uncharacterized protein n=1 Tax=Temperatibacter marinus TaxID=1456591 RepID=A0AA52EDR1_9PROT|nr:hypothetical protein [Temperatibacter marinus]WND02911.1 hypothetical protein QGN29_00855 [Temperatibacter marinus]